MPMTASVKVFLEASCAFLTIDQNKMASTTTEIKIYIPVEQQSSELI